MISEPYYNEDVVTKGYLDKELNNTNNSIEELASTKTRNWNTQPEPPYSVGDTWAQGSTGDIYTCINPREYGSYTASDWIVASGVGQKATDAMNTAQSKVTTYIKKPSSYKIGDLWKLEDGVVHPPDKQGTVLMSIANSSTYDSSHWVADSSVVYAIDKAESAEQDAQGALTAALEAKTNAQNAINELENMSDDAKLAPAEKKSVKNDWNTIYSEKDKIVQHAQEFNIDSTEYVTYYTTLAEYIEPLLMDMNVTSNIDGSTFRNNFTNYYNSRTNLLNAIASKAMYTANDIKIDLDKIENQTKTDTGNNITLTNSNGNYLLDLTVEGQSIRVESPKTKTVSDVDNMTVSEIDNISVKNLTLEIPATVFNSGDERKIIFESGNGAEKTYSEVSLPNDLILGGINNVNDIVKYDGSVIKKIAIITLTETSEIPDAKPNSTYLCTEAGQGILNNKTFTMPDGYSSVTVYYELENYINMQLDDLISMRKIPTYKGASYVTTSNNIKAILSIKYLLSNPISVLYTPTQEVNANISEIRQQLHEIDIIVGETGPIHQAISQINVALESINLQVEKKVGTDEIIAKINISPETIKLLASKIALEGYTTINGSFSIDTNGTVSISYGNVIINADGIKLSNGARLIGGNGVLSNFDNNSGTWQKLGFEIHDEISEIKKKSIELVIYVPNNFSVVSAKVQLIHTPQYLSNLPENMVGGGTITNEWCYARNVRLYKKNAENAYFAGKWGSEYLMSDNGSETEIPNAFGTNGFTAKKPSNIPPSSNPVETIESIDIKDYINIGKYNRILIGTANTLNYSTQWKEAYKQTGFAMATINVIGYMS